MSISYDVDGSCKDGRYYLRELMEAMGLFENEVPYEDLLKAILETSEENRDNKSTYIPHFMGVLLSYVELTTKFEGCCISKLMTQFDDNWDETLFKEFRY